MADVVSTNNPGHLRPGLLEKFKLAILVPSTETWMGSFGLSLVDLCKSLSEAPIGSQESDWFLINRQGSMLAYNREMMALSALSDSDVTHVLMLDSDMKFPPDTVHWMINRKVPFVFANYPRRQVPSWPVVKGLDNKWMATTDSKIGLEKVRAGGLGVCLVAREVFEKMPRPWFHFEWVKQNGQLELLGEDIWFCDKVRGAGFDVLVDHDLTKFVEHAGTFDYTYQMMVMNAQMEEAES